MMDFEKILSDLEYAQEIFGASVYKDTVDDLISLVEKEEKHRWHDLRKNPTDLPPGEDKGYMVKQIDVEQPFSAYWTKSGFYDEVGEGLNGIIAWREIEPFAEDEE